MISVEPATVEWVSARFKHAPKADLERSIEIWKVKDDGVPVLVLGVVRKDLIGWAEIWCIITDGLEYHWWSSLRELRKMMAVVKERYPGLIAHARPGTDERFARFFGFHEVMRTPDYVRFTL